MKVGDEIYWAGWNNLKNLHEDKIDEVLWWGHKIDHFSLKNNGKIWSDLCWIVPKNELTAILYGVEC